MQTVPIANAAMELTCCRDAWRYDAEYRCWKLEDVLYTAKATNPAFQRLSVFVPAAYLRAGGEIDPGGVCGGYTAASAPVVFENNAAGYMQMPHAWLGGPRCYAEPYLAHGFVYVTCGCRGRDSYDEDGQPTGKAPVSLIDLKTAIRFLRHNRACLPGDWARVISVGWSAGGAMSALLGVTGDCPRYDAALREAGAFMDESDAVFAAQVYCPIIDLEHADMAYEWMFAADKTCEDSPAGPAETMTPFKEALSRELAARYVRYVNGMGLRDPGTGESLTLSEDGRGGSFYVYFMRRLERSASDFLARLNAGALPLRCTPEAYLRGEYEVDAPAPFSLPRGEGRMPGLGETLLRPPEGVTFRGAGPRTVRRRGDDKRDWLSWDGRRARISGLDAYVLGHRRRMKPCTAFDKLTCDSGENQVFGAQEADFAHFSPSVRDALAALRADFPQESERYAQAYAGTDDAALAGRVALLNPLSFIGTGEACKQAAHYRIRVGASDADTSLSVSMTLALRLANAGFDVDDALVWDQPHSEADYPGEAIAWIDGICREEKA